VGWIEDLVLHFPKSLFYLSLLLGIHLKDVV